MTHTTPKRKAVDGFETITATTNNFKRTVALYARIKVILVRSASWMAVMCRGIA